MTHSMEFQRNIAFAQIGRNTVQARKQSRDDIGPIVIEQIKDVANLRVVERRYKSERKVGTQIQGHVAGDINRIAHRSTRTASQLGAEGAGRADGDSGVTLEAPMLLPAPIVPRTPTELRDGASTLKGSTRTHRETAGSQAEKSPLIKRAPSTVVLPE